MASTSASGRTSASLDMDSATGALTVVISRDDRVVHRFDLGRELDVNKGEGA